MIILSYDYYIRLPLETLSAIQFVHFLSGLDEHTPFSSHEGASFAHISGYTEWLSTGIPTITLGWDWELGLLEGRSLYVRLDAPRSNIMLVDAMQRDLGATNTTLVLEAAIDALPWREEVHRHLVTRYA